MAVFNAWPDKHKNIVLNKCHNGHKAEIADNAIWDAPGDCAPIIESYTYAIYCPKCKLSTCQFDTAEEAAKHWNCLFPVINK
jgi:hypothetical protein